MRRAVILSVVAVATLAMLPSAAGAGGPVGSGPGAKRSAGCRADAVVPPGEEQLFLDSDDLERQYIRHVPPGYDGTTPLPLVLDLHGYLEGAAIHAIHSGLGPFGDERGFITLTPNGTGVPVRWDATVRSPDVRFLERLLDETERVLCVDRRRVFVAGLSNGAFMTSALACALSDRIAAVAPIAGVRDIRRCRPERDVPVVAFHGTADAVVAYDGGLGPVGLSLPAPGGSGQTIGELAPELAEGPSVPEMVAAWAKRNGCKTKTTEEQIAEDVTKITWKCDADASVELYRITGGGHSWPGSEFSRSIAYAIGPTTFSIVANEVMWEFFQDHPLKGRLPD